MRVLPKLRGFSARGVADAKAPGGFQQAGLLWNAYAKGYRLGTISASDSFAPGLS